MANLIPLAIGAGIEYLTGLGATVAVATEAATGSAAVGSIAGSAVVGTAASTVSNFLVGEEATKSIEETVQESRDAALALTFQDPRFLSGPLVQQLLDQNNQSNQATKNPFDVPIKEAINNPEIANPERTVSGLTNFPSGPIVKDKLQNYSPRDIIDVVDYLGKKVVSTKNTNIPEHLKGLMVSDDFYKPIGESLLDYFNDNATFNSDEYKGISSVYNMKDRSGNMLTINGNTEYIKRPDGRYDIYFIDERGIKIGPMTSGQKGDYYIPQVYGEYGGPASINSKPPIDIVDLAFLAHDVDFTVNSYFDKKSDLKLLSRLTSLLNLGLVPTGSIELIKSIMLYFSTVGIIIDNLRGGNDRIGQDYIDVLPENDGIFTLAQPLAVNLDEDDYKLERFKFYNELDEAYADVLVSGQYGGIVEDVEIVKIRSDLNNMSIQLM